MANKNQNLKLIDGYIIRFCTTNIKETLGGNRSFRVGFARSDKTPLLNLTQYFNTFDWVQWSPLYFHHAVSVHGHVLKTVVRLVCYSFFPSNRIKHEFLSSVEFKVFFSQICNNSHYLSTIKLKIRVNTTISVTLFNLLFNNISSFRFYSHINIIYYNVLTEFHKGLTIIFFHFYVFNIC